MSSYFDETDQKIRAAFETPDPGSKAEDGEVRWTEFWKRYRAIENQLVEDCLKACRARKFPLALGAKIHAIVQKNRVFATSKAAEMNERAAHALLSMRHSFLSSELHSVFHDVARYGHEANIRWLTDSPAWMAKRAPLEKGLSR